MNTSAWRSVSIWTLLLTAVLITSSTPVFAVTAQALTSAAPSARVVQKVDNSQRMVLPGHVPLAIRGAADLGRIDPNTPMQHMVMVLQGSSEQEHALRTLIDKQHDKNSANYHQWLTPEAFQASYGVAESDISAVSDWLSKQGLTVEHVARGGRILQFSGTVGNVEQAFQTEFHSYQVGGAQHISINSDLSIPSALSPVIRSIPTVHNFFKTSSLGPKKVVSLQRIPGSLTPEFTSGNTHYTSPNDFAVIYNTAPLLSSGINGKGIKIGIVGRTDIGLNDVQAYREMFGLPSNDPNFIVAGEDPGVVPGDDGESYLDVEVSGGVATGATIDFVSSKATLTVDGVDLSSIYLIENNLVDIISESYGLCENSMGSSNTLELSLWEQAAAQGISVFVSSGDNGPASCDSSNSTYSSYGYSVSGDASTPYNVAVGGTEFLEGSGTYWATSNGAGYETALSYIPEVPWNEAKGNSNGYSGDASGLWSGSGGISAYYTTPSWQRGPGITGTDPSYAGTSAKVDPSTPVVAGPHRYLPDVALNAASSHDGTLYCAEGICQLTSTGFNNAGIVGGTSVAAPMMAGIQALIDQANGGRQGLPNFYYYSLAIANNTAGLNCASNATPAAGCAFHDITSGNNLICANSSCTTANKIGWTAAAGYDLASGLGSPNVYQLATQWSSIKFSSSATTLNVSSVGATHGSSSTLIVTVAAGSGSGTPTGDVAFYTDGGAITNAVDENTGVFTTQAAFCTLSAGTCTVNLSTLPAGTYHVLARYAGDATYGSSTSAPVSVSISAENSSLSLAANTLNCTSGAIAPTTSFAYGSLIFLDTKVTGLSGNGVPTGTVSYTLNGSPLSTQSLNSTGDVEMVIGAIPTSSCVYGYSFDNGGQPPVGTYSLSASYSGDSSFTSTTLATPITVTVTPATLTTSLKTTSTEIASGGSVNLILTLTPLAAASQPVAPTGTVTYVDTTTSTTLGTASIGNGLYANVAYALATLSTTGLTTTGAHSITATYSGDSNYASSSSTVTVTVGGTALTSLTLTTTTTTPILGTTTNTLTATLAYTGASPTGTVYFYDGTMVIGSSSVSGSTHAATLATLKLLTAGTHTVTATYGGSTTYSSKTSSGLTITVSPATPTVDLTAKNVALPGAPVTLTTVVNVPSASSLAYFAPVGYVQYYDGVTPVGPPVALTDVTYASGGYGLWEAVYTTTSLSNGTHSITGQYYGDSNYTSVTTNVQTVTIGALSTTTSLTTSLSNVVPGQSVILTATVLPTGIATPTGTVTFAATSTGSSQGVLGVVNLVNGVAVYNGLVYNGDDAITATYGGDSNNAGSTSNSVKVTNASITGKLSLNWPALSFGQPVSYGGSSGSWPVLVQNLTGVTVAAPTVSVSGAGAANFVINTNTCSSSLIQGATCSFNVVFSPTTGGSAIGSLTSATLTVSTSTSANYTTTLALSGTAVSSSLGFNWPFLNFTPSVSVGSVAPAWPVTLVNLSGTSTTLATPAVSFTDGSFKLTSDTCSGTTLGAGASCTFSVLFSPLAADITQVGTNIISGTLTASGNSGAVTGSLPVSGWGAAGLGFNWPFLTFPNQPIGSTGNNPWPVTVTNQSGQALTGITYTFTGVTNYQSNSFTLSGTCTTLAPGASCTFNVLPSPVTGQSAGPYSATLVVSGTAGATTINSYPLSVSGVVIGGGFSINWNQDQQAGVSTIDFGPHNQSNVTTGPWPITVYNNSGSTQTLTLTPSLAVFTTDSSTCTNVVAGGTCIFNLYFTPTAKQVYQGTLLITGSVSGSYSFNTWGQSNF